MWNSAGVIHHHPTLLRAQERVREMLRLPIGRLLKLRLLVSETIISSAIRRTHS